MTLFFKICKEVIVVLKIQPKTHSYNELKQKSR